MVPPPPHHNHITCRSSAAGEHSCTGELVFVVETYVPGHHTRTCTAIAGMQMQMDGPCLSLPPPFLSIFPTFRAEPSGKFIRRPPPCCLACKLAAVSRQLACLLDYRCHHYTAIAPFPRSSCLPPLIAAYPWLISLLYFLRNYVQRSDNLLLSLFITAHSALVDYYYSITRHSQCPPHSSGITPISFSQRCIPYASSTCAHAGRSETIRFTTICSIPRKSHHYHRPTPCPRPRPSCR